MAGLQQDIGRGLWCGVVWCGVVWCLVLSWCCALPGCSVVAPLGPVSGPLPLPWTSISPSRPSSSHQHLRFLSPSYNTGHPSVQAIALHPTRIVSLALRPSPAFIPGPDPGSTRTRATLHSFSSTTFVWNLVVCSLPCTSTFAVLACASFPVTNLTRLPAQHQEIVPAFSSLKKAMIRITWYGLV
ncbi:hypothetical protein BKA80DRAFT_315395 [Phyllosticta citrichinensis]